MWIIKSSNAIYAFPGMFSILLLYGTAETNQSTIWGHWNGCRLLQQTNKQKGQRADCECPKKVEPARDPGMSGKKSKNAWLKRVEMPNRINHHSLPLSLLCSARPPLARWRLPPSLSHCPVFMDNFKICINLSRRLGICLSIFSTAMGFWAKIIN